MPFLIGVFAVKVLRVIGLSHSFYRNQSDHHANSMAFNRHYERCVIQSPRRYVTTSMANRAVDNKIIILKMKILGDFVMVLFFVVTLLCIYYSLD